MATTDWIKTLSNHNLGEGEFVTVEYAIPHSFILSGNGKVFYTPVAYSTSLVRYECSEDNVWTPEYFIGTPYYTVTGTKYLPDPTFVYPVATSEDGNILVLMKGGDPRNDRSTKRKLLVVSYVNGQLVQVGSEITFTKQSNFNDISPTNIHYYIRRVSISNDGLKIVIVTHGGINTLVFSNGSWNLLPASQDILPSYFPWDDYSDTAGSSMSKNGMYLTLISVNTSIMVFKFNNLTNSWNLFKTIPYAYSIWETFVSNTGIVLAVRFGTLARFEYNLSTNEYESTNVSNIVSLLEGSRCFVSDDFNTLVCRSGDYSWPPTGLPRQYIVMIKWINGNWEKVDLPETIIPMLTSEPLTYGFVLGMSSDATTFISTTVDSSLYDPNIYGPYLRSIINVYHNLPLPTLSLGIAVSVKEKNVDFDVNANVFVKAPTVPLNVSNKQYVDIADAEINALILSNASTDTTSTTEYYVLIGQTQTVQSTLATQIDNLYQYFFNQSREDAVIINQE
jgi:hypothetical protein